MYIEDGLTKVCICAKESERSRLHYSVPVNANGQKCKCSLRKTRSNDISGNLGKKPKEEEDDAFD